MSNENVILTPEKKKEKYVPDPKRVAQVENTLVKVRMNLLIHQPFWGQLAARLDLQDASGWCPTCATDGRFFYYNVDFVEGLDFDELKFVFAHEIEHCAYDHFTRLGHRQPDIWNAAADYAINWELDQAKIGKMPKVGLLDSKFADMYAEEIYEWLYKNADKIKIPQPMDMHLDMSGDDDGEGAGDDEYQPGDENNQPKIGKNISQDIQDEFKNAVINAAKQAEASGAGNMPAGLARLIKQWTKPQLDWRQFLEARIQSTVRNDYTWMNPSRRGELPGGIIMPGTTHLETIKVHIAIDTSGSMTEQMLKDLMGEVAGIMEQFEDFEVHTWCFDACVIRESYKVFTAENLDEVYDYQLMGGGGTLFMSNWEFMKENDIEPITFLLFTDGYPCDSWGDPNYCDTIFLVHGSEDIKSDFGLTLYYKKAKSD